MIALILISQGRVMVVIVDSFAHCLIAAQAVAHLGLVACGGAGLGV